MKIFVRILIGLVAILITTGVMFRKEITQLYHVINLFEADVIVHNFSNIDTLIDTEVIERTGGVNSFGNSPVTLPEAFTHDGEETTLTSWLDQTSATALLVVKGDDILHEDYFQGTEELDQRISWSMAKSVLSAMFGIAVEEGDIKSLDEPVTDYVPMLVGTGYDNVRIKDVLQMSSGVLFNEDYGDFNSDINRFGRVLAIGGSFDDFAASLTRDKEPGTYMHYVSIDTHVIGMVLRAATGRDIGDYFNEKIYSKLGFESDAYYIIDSAAQPMVLGGLNMITRDYARFGQLYRDYGVFNGEQIVPRQWTIDSVTPDASHLMPGVRENSSSKFGYGYQWWIPENADDEFMAIGIYGQYIYVNRKLDVVIVKNSADRNFMENNYAHSDYNVAAFRHIASSVQ